MSETTPAAPIPGLLGLLMNPLVRRGYHTPALVLGVVALTAMAGAASYGLLALALADVLPSPLMLLSGLVGSLLAIAAGLGLMALTLTAPVWLIASITERWARPRA
ncbi:hypothetical protein [Streptomyces sp. HUAS TT7]|uniref:hypothetical protein n=1 Tax=Streptomyces sp. HUAS TT7 TaxID=3447507 RepID=UPI003F65E7C6